MMKKIFISYAWSDNQDGKIRNFYESIKKNNWFIFFDQKNLNIDYKHEINEALNNINFFIFFYSKNYYYSEMCNYEYLRALKIQKEKNLIMIQVNVDDYEDKLFKYEKEETIILNINDPDLSQKIEKIIEDNNLVNLNLVNLNKNINNLSLKLKNFENLEKNIEFFILSNENLNLQKKEINISFNENYSISHSIEIESKPILENLLYVTKINIVYFDYWWDKEEMQEQKINIQIRKENLEEKIMLIKILRHFVQKVKIKKMREVYNQNNHSTFLINYNEKDNKILNELEGRAEENFNILKKEENKDNYIEKINQNDFFVFLNTKNYYNDPLCNWIYLRALELKGSKKIIEINHGSPSDIYVYKKSKIYYDHLSKLHDIAKKFIESSSNIKLEKNDNNGWNISFFKFKKYFKNNLVLELTSNEEIKEEDINIELNNYDKKEIKINIKKIEHNKQKKLFKFSLDFFYEKSVYDLLDNVDKFDNDVYVLKFQFNISNSKIFEIENIYYDSFKLKNNYLLLNYSYEQKINTILNPDNNDENKWILDWIRDNLSIFFYDEKKIEYIKQKVRSMK